jgi:protein-S-isoprenylcysteine O-methyltransferase Ste14
MTGVGLLVAAAGLLVAARSAQLLLGRGRPKRGPRPALVIAGPYVRVRNPLLGGLVVGCAGSALALRSPGLALVTAAGAGLAHLWITLVEEPRLRDRFGAAYEAYLDSVPRWVPGGRATHAP